MMSKIFLALAFFLICTTAPQIALTQTVSGVGTERKVDKTFVIRGKKRPTTHTLLPDDELGRKVCGKQLYFAEGGDRIRFNCDGTGEYVNATGVPPNEGKLIWGFRIADEDPTKLVVKSFRDVGYGSIDKPTLAIMYQFTTGLDDKETIWGGALGEWTDGRVLLIFGHVPTAGGAYISK